MSASGELIRRVVTVEARRVRRRLLWWRANGSQELDENSLTRELIRRLRKQAPDHVFADVVPGMESLHGADLELWFRVDGLYVGFHLQAKKLGFPRPKHPFGKYDELHHNINHDPSRPQVDALTERTTKPLNAAYLFYNGLSHKPTVDSGCCSFNGYAKQHGRLGLTLTSAAVVRRFREERITDFEAVLPYSLPLQCTVLCRQSTPGWTGWTRPGPLAHLGLGWAGFDRMFATLDPERDSPYRDDRTDRLVQVVASSPPSYVLSLVRGEGVVITEDVPDCDYVAVIDLGNG